MRVRMLQRRMTAAQADKLHYYLQAQSGIRKVTVSERTMDVTILYNEKTETRGAVIQALSDFGYERSEVEVPAHTGRELSRTYEDKLFFLVISRALRRILLPVPFRRLYCLGKAARYICEA